MNVIRGTFGDLALGTPFVLDAGAFIFEKIGAKLARRIDRPGAEPTMIGEAVRVRLVFNGTQVEEEIADQH